MVEAPLHGVLIVDKPSGMTSHDVVARARRLLRERRIGHAGTLDPMATGVLVVLVGEATKLAGYLTASDKRYTAKVAFGRSTATLDAEGETVAEGEVPAGLCDDLGALQRGEAPAGLMHAALEGERRRKEQVPPAFSAIHVDGERSHELARAGKEVALAARAVEARAIEVVAASAEAATVDLDVLVSKGYYVRSLARDLGERVGAPAHLAALRRTQSGAFTLEHAVTLEAGADALRAAVIPLERAAVLGLPGARLTSEGVVRARQGKKLGDADFAEAPPAGEGASAWMDPDGKLVAIGERRGEALAVLRGFAGS